MGFLVARTPQGRCRGRCPRGGAIRAATRSISSSGVDVYKRQLSDLGEFRGKQELYTRQSPLRLKALREHALIESAVSSNRIEGVSVEPSRVRDVVVSARPLFRDRDEEEVRGYSDTRTRSLIHREM